MGQRGPKPTPAAILKQRGTFRPDRHADDGVRAGQRRHQRRPAPLRCDRAGYQDGSALLVWEPAMAGFSDWGGRRRSTDRRELFPTFRATVPFEAQAAADLFQAPVAGAVPTEDVCPLAARI